MRSQNFYTARNNYVRLTGNDGEAFTSDGGSGAYFGSVSSVSGGTLVLKDDPGWSRANWRGAMVAVTGGHGLGQWRILESYSENTIVVSQPFEIAPDRTSTVTIVPLQLHYLFYRNRISDAGLAIQFYGSGIEHIVAENDAQNTGGLFVVALNYLHGIQPEIDVQLLGNVVSGMNYSNGVPGPSSIEARSESPSAIIGLVIRGNELKNNSTIRVKSWSRAGVKGMLLEDNRPQNSGNVSIDNSVAAEVVVR
jgi:hypothetical protein